MKVDNDKILTEKENIINKYQLESDNKVNEYDILEKEV
jgi:hypothetical protein